jgi:hypothetical protein
MYLCERRYREEDVNFFFGTNSNKNVHAKHRLQDVGTHTNTHSNAKQANARVRAIGVERDSKVAVVALPLVKYHGRFLDFERPTRRGRRCNQVLPCRTESVELIIHPKNKKFRLGVVNNFWTVVDGVWPGGDVQSLARHESPCARCCGL